MTSHFQRIAGSPVNADSRSALKSELRDTLGSLQRVSAHFGLKANHSSILNMLVSFLRDLTADGRPVIYASNRAMCERAHGMELQTLQRGLRRLIEAGLIRRHTSPNGKRYTHRAADGTILEAFGIDISPLIERRAEIQELSASAHAQEIEMRILRDRLSCLRYNFAKNSPQEDRIRALLRRGSASAGDFLDLIAALEAELGTDVIEPNFPVHPAEIPTETKKMTPSEYQIDAHQQNIKQNIYDKKQVADHRNREVQVEPMICMEEDLPDLETVFENCPSALEYSPYQINTWRDAIGLAFELAPHIGIRTELAARAGQKLGLHGFAMTIFVLVQRCNEISNAPGYLQRILQPSIRPYDPRRFLHGARAHRAVAA